MEKECLEWQIFHKLEMTEKSWQLSAKWKTQKIVETAFLYLKNLQKKYKKITIFRIFESETQTC